MPQLPDFKITNQTSVTENTNNTSIPHIPKQSGIHTQSKHTYRNTFGESNIQYHNFDNQDSLTFRQIHCIITTRITKPILELTGPSHN